MMCKPRIDPAGDVTLGYQFYSGLELDLVEGLGYQFYSDLELDCDRFVTHGAEMERG
jgi:hypothetical protein